MNCPQMHVVMFELPLVFVLWFLVVVIVFGSKGARHAAKDKV